LLTAPEPAYAMADRFDLHVAEQLADVTVFDLPSANGDAQCDAFLRAMLAEHLLPLRFELREPNLHEIFLEKVGADEALEGGTAA
jgi:ABC-type uncharacterized transport system ATPase subunit